MDQTTELHPSEKEEEKKWSSRDKYSSDEEHTNISPRSPSERHRDSHRHENERRMPSPKNGEEYHECCRECNRDHRRNGRACICQVPSSQRRAPLGESGCITCGCTGCHTEDLQRKKEMGIPLKVKKDEPKLSDDAPLKNGCCKPCMRAFSETKRACLCQVPFDVRIGALPTNGCKICGCKGCHPEELLMKKKGVTLKHRRGPAPGSRVPPPHYPAPPFYPFGDPYMRRYDPYGRDSYRHGDRYRSRSRSPERSRGRSPRRFHSDSRDKSPSYRKERSRSRDRSNRKRDRSRERSASPGRKDRRQE